MAITTRAILKSLFIKGVIPSADDFASLIDTAFSLEPTDGQINNLTLNSSPASGANLLIQEPDGSFKRVPWSNLPDGGGGGGEVNNGSNKGTNSPDISIFNGKPALDLEFNGIKWADNNIESSFDAVNFNYDVNLNLTNLKSNLSLNLVENFAQMRQAANRWATAFSATTTVDTGSRWLLESNAHSHAKRYILHENMPFSPRNTSTVTKGASWTLADTEDNKVVETSGATTITLDTGLRTGFWCIITKTDASNEITFAAGTGTLRSNGTKLATQYTGATVWHKGSGVFYVWGQLTT